MAHKHSRSTNNTGANPGFVAKVRELLAQTDEELGLVDSCTLQAEADNQKAVAAALDKASKALQATVNKEDPWTDVGSVQQQLWTPDNLIDGKNPLTLCEAQWVNDGYPQGVAGQRTLFEFVKNRLAPLGCQGVETVVWRFDDPLALLTNDTLRDQYLEVHQLVDRVDVLSAHCWGQGVTDRIRKAHAGLCPLAWRDGNVNPYGVNFRSGVMMMVAAMMAKRLKLNDVIHGFIGGAGLWHAVYDFARSDDDLQQGVDFLTGMWNPILDFFAHIRMVHGLEVHGTEAGFDWYSFLKIREAFGDRPEFGAGHDGSHYKWQGIDSALALKAAAVLGILYHMHFKSVKFDKDPLAGIMRALTSLGKVEQGGGWWFNTVGEGQDHLRRPERILDEVDAIVLSAYYGNVSAENEQPGANPEEQMVRAITNVAAALYAPGEVHMPDAAA